MTSSPAAAWTGGVQLSDVISAHSIGREGSGKMSAVVSQPANNGVGLALMNPEATGQGQRSRQTGWGIQ